MVRYLICRDQFWWKNSESPWKINLEHPWVKPVYDTVTGAQCNPYNVSEWRDRVLNLCEYEVTHQFFGLGYNELMRLDTAEFEDIEKRVYRMAKKQSEHLDKFRTGTSNKQDQINLLKDFKK